MVRAGRWAAAAAVACTTAVTIREGPEHVRRAEGEAFRETAEPAERQVLSYGEGSRSDTARMRRDCTW